MNERSHLGEDPGDLQVREPQSGRVARRRLVSSCGRDVEERFFLITKILDFAAICNRKGFSEWTQL